MYEQVAPNAPRKKKRSTRLWICLILALLLLITAIIPTIWGAWYRKRFYAFVSDLSDSTGYAYRHASLSITWEGKRRVTTATLGYAPYQLLGSMGPGKPTSPPARTPNVLLDYGDGSTLAFWPTEEDGPAQDTAQSGGLVAHYVNQAGDPFTYIVDSVTLDSLESLLFPRQGTAP